MSTPEIPNALVGDIQIVKSQGPWRSKSGGDLIVRFAFSVTELQKILDFDSAEFARIEQESGLNIRGLRSYEVRDIPAGSVGGKEWHAARTEALVATAGRAVVWCADQTGGAREIAVDRDTMAIIPPGIFHTYEALQNGTTLQVLCNTLYVPDDPRTYDTYFADSFAPLNQ